jgi:hypothetical protein
MRNPNLTFLVLGTKCLQIITGIIFHLRRPSSLWASLFFCTNQSGSQPVYGVYLTEGDSLWLTDVNCAVETVFIEAPISIGIPGMILDLRTRAVPYLPLAASCVILIYNLF